MSINKTGGGGSSNKYLKAFALLERAISLLDAAYVDHIRKQEG